MSAGFEIFSRCVNFFPRFIKSLHLLTHGRAFNTPNSLLPIPLTLALDVIPGTFEMLVDVATVPFIAYLEDHLDPGISEWSEPYRPLMIYFNDVRS